jgi:hypothetical protein
MSTHDLESDESVIVLGVACHRISVNRHGRDSWHHKVTPFNLTHVTIWSLVRLSWVLTGRRRNCVCDVALET